MTAVDSADILGLRERAALLAESAAAHERPNRRSFPRHRRQTRPPGVRDRGERHVRQITAESVGRRVDDTKPTTDGREYIRVPGGDNGRR